jgi:hypothetical protein
VTDYHQWIGFVGSVLIVGTYFLLQVECISNADMAYSVLNALGAALLIFSLFFAFNLAAMIVECFWAIISVIGVVRCLRTRNKPRDTVG